MALDTQPFGDAETKLLARTAKTRKGKKVLENRQPRVFEGPKNVLLLRGTKTTPPLLKFLSELKVLLRPECVYLNRRREGCHPFEDIGQLERLAEKQNCGIALFASHSKKRPMTLTLARFFNRLVLDIYELHLAGIETPIEVARRLKQSVASTPPGSKPLILFQGSHFDTCETLRGLKQALADLFNRGTPAQVLLKGLSHVIVVTSIDRDSALLSDSTRAPLPRALDDPASGVVLKFQQFNIVMRKSNARLPFIFLQEIGPACCMSVGRTKLPDRATMKAATVIPRESKPKKIKNVETNVLGEKRGRIHIGVQDMSQVHTPLWHDKGAKKRKVGPTAASTAFSSDA